MGAAVVSKSGELSRLKLVEGLKSPSPEGSYCEPLYQFQAIFIYGVETVSIKTMGRAWDNSLAKGSALLVLLAIADNARDNGLAWPGIKSISKRSRLSKRQVIRIIEQLEKAEDLEVIRKKSGNCYWIKCWGLEGPDFIYCKDCGAIEDVFHEVLLDQHHPDKANKPDYMITLCDRCHFTVHNNKQSDKLSPQFKVPLPKSEVTPKAKEVTPKVIESDIAVSPEPLKNHQLKPSNNNQRGNRPPAVELCKRIIFRYPHKSLWKTIDRKVGNEFLDLLRWGRILRKWKLSNFNITNYKGMLENFNRERSQDDNIDYESAAHRRKYAEGWLDD